jgi:hypothetical protein
MEVRRRAGVEKVKPRSRIARKAGSLFPLRADTSFSLLTVLAGFVEGYRTENPADHALGA